MMRRRSSDLLAIEAECRRRPRSAAQGRSGPVPAPSRRPTLSEIERALQIGAAPGPAGRSKGTRRLVAVFDRGEPIHLGLREERFVHRPGVVAGGEDVAWGVALDAGEGVRVEAFDAPRIIDIASIAASTPWAAPAPAPASMRPAASATASASTGAEGEFDDDIHAISASAGPAAGRSERRPTEAEPSLSERPEPDLAFRRDDGGRHAVFDAIGQGMRYANTFDLGSVALDRRLEALDAELGAEIETREQSARRSPASKRTARSDPAESVAVELDDVDIAEELAMIAEAAGLPISPEPPAAERPVHAPSTTADGSSPVDSDVADDECTADEAASRPPETPEPPPPAPSAEHATETPP